MVLALASFLPGCGGGASPAAGAGVPTGKEIERCVIEAGGTKWTETPLEPSGFPTNLEIARTIGPSMNHITVYVARHPVFTQRLVKGFDDIGEYRAVASQHGRILILLDHDTSKRDEELAFKCVEG
jgi:hypothetical protein